MSWTSCLYRRSEITNRYNELEILLEEVHEPYRRLGYVFRVYDEGAAFRYVIPQQDGVPGFELLREESQWCFPGKCSGWFTSYKSDFNSNENQFLRRDVNSIVSDDFIGLPGTVEVGGSYIAFCEAALVNWAGFYLKTPKGESSADASVFETHLTPLPPSEASTRGWR